MIATCVAHPGLRSRSGYILSGHACDEDAAADNNGAPVGATIGAHVPALFRLLRLLNAGKAVLHECLLRGGRVDVTLRPYWLRCAAPEANGGNIRRQQLPAFPKIPLSPSSANGVARQASKGLPA